MPGYNQKGPQGNGPASGGGRGGCVSAPDPVVTGSSVGQGRNRAGMMATAPGQGRGQGRGQGAGQGQGTGQVTGQGRGLGQGGGQGRGAGQGGGRCRAGVGAVRQPVAPVPSVIQPEKE